MKQIFLALCAMAWANYAHAQLPTYLTPDPEMPNADGIQRDNYFGTVVADPYRLFEATDHPVAQSFVLLQNRVTNDYFQKIAYFDSITARLKTLANFERFSKIMAESDGYIYFLRNSGMENQSVLYRQKGMLGQPIPVLDPNTFSADGTTALGEYSFSADHRFMAFATQPGGSDKQIAQVLELGTGLLLPDKLTGLIFSNLAWQGDGFYYQRFPDSDIFKKNQFAKIYFHRLGQPQERDELVYEDRNPNMMFGVKTYNKERYLVVTGAKSTSKNSVFVRDLTQPGSKFIAVVGDDETADYEVIGIENGKMYVATNDAAPNNRLVEIDLNKPDHSNWNNVLAERPGSVLQNCWLAGGQLVAHYLVDCASTLQLFDLQGKAVGSVTLPDKMGQVTEFNSADNGSGAFFAYETFYRPSSIYSLDLKNLQTTVFKAVQSPFDSDRYETKQVWYTSKDGTKIPMSITIRKGLVPNEKTPCLQYAYGGFASPSLPRYRLFNIAFLESGGIYCVVNIRGGNEFGEKWHEAGTKGRKQNVFDDFIAASEWLIANHYTSKEFLAINGASNGGLLVGACLTQRPELYQVCLPQVGVMDMLRYTESTVGTHWIADYGDPKTAEGFQYIYPYSPLHNIKRMKYPATLIMTSEKDDRVAPWHSYKFAATLQDNQQDEKPILLRVTSGAGHGTGKSTAKQIEEASAMLAFTLYNMGIQYAPLK